MMYAVELCSVGCDNNGDVIDISNEDMYKESEPCPKCGQDKFNLDPRVLAEVMIKLYEDHEETFEDIKRKLKLTHAVQSG